MAMDSMALLDSYGRKLLSELQANSRLSLAELGRRIGLSPTATAERLKQMEEIGILRGYTVEIEREALGLEVLAFIRMSCNGQNYYRLLNYVRTLEEVRECHHLTGGDDLLLKVTTTNLRPGYLRKNGVPFSDKTTVTEYYDIVHEPDGNDWVIVKTIVNDPTYLTEPFITSTNLRKQRDSTGWNPTACTAR